MAIHPAALPVLLEGCLQLSKVDVVDIDQDSIIIILIIIIIL